MLYFANILLPLLSLSLSLAKNKLQLKPNSKQINTQVHSSRWKTLFACKHICNLCRIRCLPPGAASSASSSSFCAASTSSSHSSSCCAFSYFNCCCCSLKRVVGYGTFFQAINKWVYQSLNMAIVHCVFLVFNFGFFSLFSRTCRVNCAIKAQPAL